MARKYRNPKNSTTSDFDRIDIIVRKVCAFFGVSFALSGLIIILTGSLQLGGFSTLLGIMFMILARKFHRFKIKAGSFEIEAQEA